MITIENNKKDKNIKNSKTNLTKFFNKTNTDIVKFFKYACKNKIVVRIWFKDLEGEVDNTASFLYVKKVITKKGELYGLIMSESEESEIDYCEFYSWDSIRLFALSQDDQDDEE